MSAMVDPFALATIPQPFEDSSESFGAAPGSVLLTSMYVFGAGMHLGAIRVNDDGEQRATDPAAQEELERVYAIYDYAFETAEIPGWEGDYVLYATPFGA